MASGEARIGVDAPCGGSKRRDAEALGLGADVLRPGEEVRHAGDRADGVADVALQALVRRERNLGERRLVDDLLDRHRAAPAFWRSARGFVAAWRLAASIAAARRPLVTATPSPQRSVR